MATIQIRVDDDLKSKADDLFKELGMDTTTAIRMFLTQAVAYGGIPFEIKKLNTPFRQLSEQEILERLAQSREEAEKGHYREANTVIGELKKAIHNK